MSDEKPFEPNHVSAAQRTKALAQRPCSVCGTRAPQSLSSIHHRFLPQPCPAYPALSTCVVRASVTCSHVCVQGCCNSLRREVTPPCNFTTATTRHGDPQRAKVGATLEYLCALCACSTDVSVRASLSLRFPRLLVIQSRTNHLAVVEAPLLEAHGTGTTLGVQIEGG